MTEKIEHQMMLRSQENHICNYQKI